MINVYKRLIFDFHLENIDRPFQILNFWNMLAQKKIPLVLHLLTRKL